MTTRDGAAARRVGVLEGGFHVLDLLPRPEGRMGLSRLARESGLPKATAYRQVEQLVELGAVPVGTVTV